MTVIGQDMDLAEDPKLSLIQDFIEDQYFDSGEHRSIYERKEYLTVSTTRINDEQTILRLGFIGSFLHELIINMAMAICKVNLMFLYTFRNRTDQRIIRTRKCSLESHNNGISFLFFSGM